MPSIINRIPPGLLSMLDIKAQGENPKFLSDTVTPGMEFLPFYELQKYEAQVSSIIATAAVGFSAGIQVPEGQYWHVKHHSVFVTNVAAGEICWFSPYIFGWLFPGAYFEGPVGDEVRGTGTATEVLTGWAPTDYWMGPGDQAGIRINNLSAAANVSVQTRLLIVRYRL